VSDDACLVSTKTPKPGCTTPAPRLRPGPEPIPHTRPSGSYGSGNSNPPPEKDTVSNVYKFFLAYDETVNGPRLHINDVGRDDLDKGIRTRMGDYSRGVTARERVDYMLGQLDKYMESHQFADGKRVSIDIVGFSRGAAMARDFANRVITRTKERRWKEKSDCVEMRFLGLWDTVAQFGALGASNDEWQLAIPAEIQHVFQAVALNENRSIFPGEAIDRGIQLGFIGSHSDIGGSFGAGDLSNVALNWITEKAKESGLAMRSWEEAGDRKWGTVTEPVLHDKSTTPPGGIPEDSLFCLKKNNEKKGDCIYRRVAEIEGLTHAESQKFIKYRDRPGFDRDGVSAITGDIDIREYAKWLQENYGLTVALR